MGKGITRERTGLLLQTLFRVLAAHPEGIAARDALEAVANQITLTEHEAGEYEAGGRRFDKILRFATVDAVKAGWMTKSKGIWSVTDAGIEALNVYRKPEAFYKEASRLYSKWRRSCVFCPSRSPILFIVITHPLESARGRDYVIG